MKTDTVEIPTAVLSSMELSTGLISKKLRNEGNMLERAAQKANALGKVSRDMKAWEALNESVRRNFQVS